jgi:hypothetical protein
MRWRVHLAVCTEVNVLVRTRRHDQQASPGRKTSIVHSCWGSSELVSAHRGLCIPWLSSRVLSWAAMTMHVCDKRYCQDCRAQWRGLCCWHRATSLASVSCCACCCCHAYARRQRCGKLTSSSQAGVAASTTGICVGHNAQDVIHTTRRP